MKKIKFVYDTGYIGTNKTEIFEFEDSATEQEIQEELDVWVENIRRDSSCFEEVE